MGKQVNHGVPHSAQPIPAKVKGKQRTAPVTYIPEGRNRKERRMIEKMNKGRS